MGNKRHRVSELVRLEARYEAEREHNAELRAELLELVRSQGSPADLVEKVLAGVKAIVAPDLAPPETNDLFTPAELTPEFIVKDPAFEVPRPGEWDENWKAMTEALKREEAEDG